MNVFFFFQAEDGIRDKLVTGVQTCALPISSISGGSPSRRPRNGGFRRRTLRLSAWSWCGSTSLARGRRDAPSHYDRQDARARKRVGRAVGEAAGFGLRRQHEETRPPIDPAWLPG